MIPFLGGWSLLRIGMSITFLLGGEGGGFTQDRFQIYQIRLLVQYD